MDRPAATAANASPATMRRYGPLAALATALMLASAGCARGVAASGAGVTIARSPNGGIQPQMVQDATGVRHLIYFRGDPAGGDILYVRHAADDPTWSAPILVNSQHGSAMVLGTVRGAQLAVGRDGRAHVGWMGSDTAEPKAPGGRYPMLYSRLSDDKAAFEPQRNLVTWASGLDGGGSIAADLVGHVYVAWHGGTVMSDDSGRAVYLTRSSDDGRTFQRERRVNPDDTGACGCCGMRVMAGPAGGLYVLYRAAGQNVDRHITLLVSSDGGEPFQRALSHPWRVRACPLSTAALWSTGRVVLAAWETAGQIYYSSFNPGNGAAPPISAPGQGQRKHPTIASNDKGETLLAWLEDTGLNRGGTLAWQVFDAAGHPTERRGRVGGAPAMDLPSAAVERDGTFLIVY